MSKNMKVGEVRHISCINRRTLLSRLKDFWSKRHERLAAKVTPEASALEDGVVGIVDPSKLTYRGPSHKRNATELNTGIRAGLIDCRLLK